MKNPALSKFSAVLLSLALMLSSFGNFLAVSALPGSTEDPPEPNHTVCSVLDFKADGTDEEDDWYAFTLSMEQALYTEGLLEVVIPAGTYYISGTVAVYSDTLITAEEGAVMISTFNGTGNILFGAHLSDNGEYEPTRCFGGADCTHGGHSQTSNVTVTGGVWDRGANIDSADTSVFSFRHGSNITFKDLTVQNATDHFINLSGTDTALIENVTIRNHIEFKGSDPAFWGDYGAGNKERFNSIEAIHLDYCNPAGESSPYAAPYDNTPSANVTVTGCTFQNVFSCVGTHHKAPGERAKNITVKNNSMTGILSYCVYADCFDNLVVSNNSAAAAGFARLHDSTATVSGNIFTAVTDKLSFEAIYAFDNTSLTAVGNKITGAGVCGINAYNGCTVKAENNEIGGSAKHALFIKSKTKAEFNSNTVNGSGLAALRADASSPLTAKDNSLGGSGESAIYCTSSTLTASGNTVADSGAGKPAVKVVDAKATLTGNNILSSSYHGIVLGNADGSSLKDNSVKSAAGTGIHIYDSDKCALSGNTVSKAGNHALMAENCKGMTVSGNTFSSPGQCGASLKDGVEATLKSNKISNAGVHALYLSKAKAEFTSNTVSTTKGTALRAANGSSLTAKNNTVNGAGEMAFYCTDSSPLTATGNTIGGTGSKKPAIKVLSSKATISGNTISSSSFDGIVIWQSNGSAVKNNTVKNTAAVGIHIYGSAGCTVSGNTVSAAKGHGIMVEGEKGLPGTATLSKNTLSNSSGFNIRLGKYAVKCVLDHNTLKNKTFSADATATYINYLSAPKITRVSNAKPGITVKWGKLSGTAKYRILRKTGSGSYIKVADVSGKSSSYTDKTAKSGTKYTYSVRCLWTDGKTYSSDYDKTGKTLLRLASPALKKATPGKKKITVSWGKTAGAKGYYVYRKTGSGKWTKIASLTGTSYTDKKVLAGKKYSYTVYAYNGAVKSAADSKGLSAKAK